VGLLAFGIIALPALVYLVGRQVVGEYAEGLGGLYAAIGDGLIAGTPVAWILILSPYATIQLVRLVVWLRPSRQTVK
jgi:hypothetical protein